MPLSNVDLENLEKSYFDIIESHVRSNLAGLLNDLSSRHMIYNDWHTQFTATARAGYNASNLDIGAERSFHRIFSSLNWDINSAPIGADLMYETENAFIHIDVKTALLRNQPDHNGRVNIGRNQTSYPAHQNQRAQFAPNLPAYYNLNTSNEKPCLTYGIQIVHENTTTNTLAILLFCIPNGQLFSVYGNSIVSRGKSGFYPTGTHQVKDFRYAYHRAPTFRLLHPTTYSVKFVHFDNSQNLHIRRVDIVRSAQIS